MRKYTLLMFLMTLACGFVSAQLVNQGGTITIQPGAKLIVETDVNNASGSIVNNGTIEVTGDFTNDGTLTSAAASKLIFKGAAASTFDANGASVAILENAKTASDVSLMSAVSVSEMVDFSGASDFILGDHNLTLAEAATTNGGATGHFVTNGLGTLNKEVSAAGTFTADLGDGTNYTPLVAAHSGTYPVGAILSTQVEDADHPDLLADATDKISRNWTLSNTLTTPSIAMTGTYVAADVTGDETKMVGARYENMEWEFGTGAQAGSTVSATTTAATSELTGMNFFGKADLTAFLEGPYQGNNLMSTSINALLPTTNPYDATETGITVPGNAVDYILVEMREAAALNTVVSSKSGFLLSDGSIVSTDGSLILLKDASATSHVAIQHRNSLGILTASPLNFTSGTITANLGDGTTALYTNGSDAAKIMADGNLAMFSGDGDSNGDVNATDFVSIWLPNNSAPYNYTTNGFADFDLSGDINAADFVTYWLANNSKITQIPQ